jgi:hypothetical protein
MIRATALSLSIRLGRCNEYEIEALAKSASIELLSNSFRLFCQEFNIPSRRIVSRFCIYCFEQSLCNGVLLVNGVGLENGKICKLETFDTARFTAGPK